MWTRLNKNWWITGIKGFLAIFLGMVLLFNPEKAMVDLTRYFGVFGVITGATIIIIELLRLTPPPIKPHRLTEAVLDIIAGILLLAFPALSYPVLIMVVAVWGVVSGINHLMAIHKFIASQSIKILMVINGVLSVVFGSGLFFLAHEDAVTLTLVIGAFALVFGIITVFTSSRIELEKY